MATLQHFARPCRQVLTNFARWRGTCQHIRAMSSSGKDDSQLTQDKLNLDPSVRKEFEELREHFGDANPDKLKNWVSYGWSRDDREEDTFHSNLMNFSLFTLIFVCGSYILLYSVDFKKRDWVMREAYLELDRREKAGLPLVDPYFVPPEQVVLPSEEEIGDTEIII
ncbi:NADH dehydrogenase 1 beta subcomplex subunit 11 ndufb11 [Mactra antiquata]